MGAIATLRFLGGLLAPPRCAVCGAGSQPSDLLCADCALRLACAPTGSVLIDGVGRVTWAAPYEDAARDLVSALKFGGRLGLARIAAAAIADTIATDCEGWTIVAVPAAPIRRRRRGFDPAEAIATHLAAELGLCRASPLARANDRRQVGRPRSERVASPPRVRAVATAPARVLLVDDVLTTGATLGACAAALRAAGCTQMQAAVFARALGGGRRGA